MAKESMNLGESFQATKITGGTKPPEPSMRHYAIGWGFIVSVIVGLLYWGISTFADRIKPSSMEERPGLHEILGHKLSGVLWIDILRASANTPKINWGLFADTTWKQYGIKFDGRRGPLANTIVNEGENLLEDCFENNTGTACTNVANIEFHGMGTSAAAITEADGGCITELTTQYNPDNTRATGSQTNNGANIYRTVGTNTVDAGVTVEEFCLMDTSTGAGNMWTRILTGTIVLAASDGIQFTYDLTIE